MKLINTSDISEGHIPGTMGYHPDECDIGLFIYLKLISNTKHIMQTMKATVK